MRFDQNAIIKIFKCYRSSSIGIFFYFVYKFKLILVVIHHWIIIITIVKKKHYTPKDSMMHYFLNTPKRMDYDNTIYFIALSENFHH